MLVSRLRFGHRQIPAAERQEFLLVLRTWLLHFRCWPATVHAVRPWHVRESRRPQLMRRMSAWLLQRQERDRCTVAICLLFMRNSSQLQDSGPRLASRARTARIRARRSKATVSNATLALHNRNQRKRAARHAQRVTSARKTRRLVAYADMARLAQTKRLSALPAQLVRSAIRPLLPTAARSAQKVCVSVLEQFC